MSDFTWKCRKCSPEVKLGPFVTHEQLLQAIADHTEMYHPR